MDKIEYTVIRSNRKTIGIQVKPEGVFVRAPYGVSDPEIQNLVRSKRDWIEKHLATVRALAEEQNRIEPYTMDEIREMANKAVKIIPKRVEHYAPLVGVDYGRITIRNQRTRWGSCSGKGNLNFNCLLALFPPQVMDSVVVHELCHRKHMNHSAAFYAEVERVFPEYRKWHKWLKENGEEYLRRMP